MSRRPDGEMRIERWCWLDWREGLRDVDKKAILGALALYLDFINLFTLSLQFTDERRR